jgi:hypothetical protein
MPTPTGHNCATHGGDYKGPDKYFMCDTCARAGCNKCECGGHARAFGEAMMESVSCESCEQFLMGVGYNLNIKERWNNGERGNISN